jgi:hypothetical protein
MNILEYHFKHGNSVQDREFSKNAFAWLKDNVGPCILDIESGREKHQKQFAPLLAESVGIVLRSDILLNGKHRAKLWKGEKWAMARIFTKAIYGPDQCSFFVAFDDDTLAVQFKLAC